MSGDGSSQPVHPVLQPNWELEPGLEPPPGGETGVEPEKNPCFSSWSSSDFTLISTDFQAFSTKLRRRDRGADAPRSADRCLDSLPGADGQWTDAVPGDLELVISAGGEGH